MKTLLKNAFVITMNDKEEVYSEGSVLVVDDKISKVGYFDLDEDVDEVIDCKGKIVMPGLVNTHVHTSQQLGRGLGDDVNLLTWLHDRIWPYESNMTEEDSYVSTLACCLEQIKCGCTSFAEPGGQHVAGMARGVAQAGLRAKLAKSTMDCGEGLPEVWQKTTDEELDKQE
ncbi:MAG: amidohydrolase family protein, partial [Frisingicoccus sp.]|nr:amidohydrolase family protein [Frisingicoccus sp.]